MAHAAKFRSDIQSGWRKAFRAACMFMGVGVRDQSRYRLFAQTDRVRTLPPHLIASIRN